MFDSTETAAKSKSFAEPSIKPYKAHRYQLSDLDLTTAPSREQFWFPENVTPWFYLKAYDRLPLEVRRRYNQLYALVTNEIFIALERDFICATIENVTRDVELGPDLRTRLDDFLSEETKHAEMFTRLSQVAAPEWYTDSTYRLLETGVNSGVFLLRQMARAPGIFSVWPWIAIFFEERTLMYSKEYLRAKENLAPVFVRTHHLHMLEEIYHVQVDEALIDRFYSRRSLPARKWAAYLLEKLVRSYTAPRRFSRTAARQLALEFNDPTIHACLQECLNELPVLRTQREFREQNFGPDATLRFRRLLKNFPEMKSVEKLIRLD